MTVSGMSPAELVFARTIHSVFDRLLPSPIKENVKKENFAKLFFKPRDKIFFKNYRDRKNFCEDGTITRRYGRVTYMLKGKIFEH